MKKSLLLTLFLVLNTVLTGCGSKSSTTNTTSIPTTSYSAGEVSSYILANISFNMHYVPMITGFPIGTDDSAIGSISAAYWIAETEVTYELWKVVYDWAADQTATDNITGHGKYSFARIDSNNGDTSRPVAIQRWREAVVWCNALTEYYNVQNNTNLKCVYCSDSNYSIPIRTTSNDSLDITAGTQDNPYVNSNAKGFRLPTSNEWELAARFIKDKNNDGDILDTDNGYEYYPGTHASGADAKYDVTDTTGITDIDGDGDVQLTSDVAVYEDNSGNSSAPVKSKGVTSVNPLGLYDMSGNEWEVCFDWDPNYEGLKRLFHGGYWGNNASYLQVGKINSLQPNQGRSDGIGLRIVITN
jgi:sulfatase modifying factor 1